ncbi:hypothetical protein J1614_004544 [Plenodomus biglobosus]|nr:hypothetical protein J1614_004544 [Plenodomus biglobosus]
MAIPIKRPRTPSPAPYLLTPPPTGVPKKRVRLSHVEVSKVSSGSSTKSNKGESPNAISEEILKDSDGDLGEMSESESTTTSNNTTPAVASSDTTATSVASERSIREKLDQFATLDLAFDTPVAVTKPFPFKLPISVRNRIYEHLLVVPAIICVRQNHTSYHDEKKPSCTLSAASFFPVLRMLSPKSSSMASKYNSSASAPPTSISFVLTAKSMLKPRLFYTARMTSRSSSRPMNSHHRLITACTYSHLAASALSRLHSFYDLQWLLSGDYNAIKNYYRGLVSLTLIVEKQSKNKGFGKKWARKEEE